MQFRQLESFATVYETRSFTAASRMLFISQPAITQQIRALETEIGCALFERTSHSVMPTHQGEIFYPYVRRLLAIRMEGLQALQPDRTDLWVHFIQGDMNDPMQQAMMRFLTENPKARLQADTAIPHASYLSAAHLMPRHLYLARRSWVQDPAIHFFELTRARYDVVLSIHDSAVDLCSQAEIRYEEVAGRNFIRMQADGYEGVYMAVIHEFLRSHVSEEHVVYCQSLLDILARLINDRGESVTVLPYFVQIPPNDQYVRRPFLCSASEDPVGLAFVEQPTPFMLSFLQLARSCYVN